MPLELLLTIYCLLASDLVILPRNSRYLLLYQLNRLRKLGFWINGSRHAVAIFLCSVLVDLQMSVSM